MLIKVLKAISRTTGFLAKTMDKSSKKTEDILETEYLHNIAEYVKEKSGDLVEKAGYATGKIEEFIEEKLEEKSN